MDVKQEIAELEKQGFRVLISHERATDIGVHEALRLRRLGGDHNRLAFPPTFPKFAIKQSNFTLSQFGGKTIVKIVEDLETKDGDTLTWFELAQGESICSPLDRFERRTGIVKALGRAKGALALVEFDVKDPE